MFSVKRNRYRGDGNGMAWPIGPSGVGVIRDTMGHRTFNAHASGVDFHRGDDIVFTQGQTVYAPITGAVIRTNYTFFGWQNSDQLNQWQVAGSSLAASHSGSSLTITASRNGSASFPSGTGRYENINERINPSSGTDNWLIQLGLTNTINVTGFIGIGVFNSALTEYIALEYNGSTFKRRGVGTTTFTANGATTSVSNQTWLRITYTSSTGVYEWLYGTDGQNWTSLGTESGRVFTTTQPTHVPTIYWLSGDTNSTPYTIGIQKTEFYDLSQSAASRFGNYITATTSTFKIQMDHFQDMVVSRGDFINIGQIIGRAGITGFDTKSGAVLEPHVHIEYHPNINYSYSNDEAINALDARYLPRIDVSNNVSVVRTRENDPEGNDSWRLAITINRADQDFDLNTISLTGNLATRTINNNTREGLDPSDNDTNNFNGVRFSPIAFDEFSSAQILNYYFRTSTVGTTFVSYILTDTQGRTLASG